MCFFKFECDLCHYRSIFSIKLLPIDIIFNLVSLFCCFRWFRYEKKSKDKHNLHLTLWWALFVDQLTSNKKKSIKFISLWCFCSIVMHFFLFNLVFFAPENSFDNNCLMNLIEIFVRGSANLHYFDQRKYFSGAEFHPLSIANYHFLIRVPQKHPTVHFWEMKFYLILM